MADKINGGGGGGFLNQLGKMVDSGVDTIGEAAQSAADTVKSGAEELGEGIKDLAADGEKLVNDTVESGRESMKELEEAGASVSKKARSLKSEFTDKSYEVAQDFTDALGRASEFASDPRVRSEAVKEFFEAPFTDYVEKGFESLGYSEEQVAVGRELMGHVVDGVGKALEVGDVDGIASDLKTLIEGTAGGVQESVEHELNSLKTFVNIATTIADVGRQEVSDGVKDTALKAFALGAGITNDLTSYVISAGTRAVADADSSFRDFLVSAPQQVESFMIRMTVNGIAKGMVKGEEREITANLSGKVYVGAGGEIELGAKASIKCINNDPLKYQITIAREGKGALGLGEGVSGLGSADGSVTAEVQDQMTFEFGPEGMSKALDLASDVIAGKVSGEDAAMHVFDEGIGLRLDSATGQFAAGLRAKLDIPGFDSKVGIKGAVTLGVGRTSAGVLGGRTKFELNANAEMGAGLTALGVNPRDKDARMSDVLIGFGMDLERSELRGIESLIGGDLDANIGITTNGSIEFTQPIDFRKAEMKAEISSTIKVNNGNLVVKAEIEMSALGEKLSTAEFAAFITSSSVKNSPDLEMLAKIAQSNGKELGDYVSSKVSMTYEHVDSWKLGDENSVGGHTKLPPVTIASHTLLGNAPEVRFSDGFENLSRFIEQQFDKDETRMKKKDLQQELDGRRRYAHISQH